MAKCRAAVLVAQAECLLADLLQAACQADQWVGKRTNIKQ
ncbi:MAG: hypothetical protein RJA02_2355 [Armatimonadota bacterium]